MTTQRTILIKGLACAVAGAVAFSGKAIVAKLIYRMGGDAVAVVGMRMLLAMPMFLLMAWWAGRGKEAPPWQMRLGWQVLGLGITGYYLASTLDFLGLQYVSANLERAILYLNPTMVLLLSAWWFKRRIQPAQLASTALAYAGVVIVWLHDWDWAQAQAASAQDMGAAQAVTWGSLLVLGSALSYAIYLMGSGTLVQQHGASWLVGWASSVACVLCLAQWAVVHAVSQGRWGAVSHLPWQAWALSGINAVFCTVLPVWLVMRAVQWIGATLASQVGMVGPLSTIWMAAWTLNEPVTPQLLLGTGAIVGGILLLTRASQAAAKA